MLITYFFYAIIYLVNTMKKIWNNILEFVKSNLLVIIIFSIFIGLEVFELDYSVYSPGGLINVEDRIENKEYSSSGSFNLTYVSYRKGTIINLLIAKLLPSYDIIDNKDIVLTNEDIIDTNNREAIQIMQANSYATYVAYKNANRDISIKEEYDYVYYIYEDSNTELKVGDRLLKCDNNDIKTFDDLSACLIKHEPGDKVNVDVARGNKIINTQSTVNDNKMIGIMVTKVFTYDLNPIMYYKFGKSESGSSGGLMIALAMYNSLVEEDITRGLKIAGTGAINVDGKVEEISGLKYKIMGAAKRKIDLFIVPSDNYDEALNIVRDNKLNIRLLKADTFEQVVNDLKNFN